MAEQPTTKAEKKAAQTFKVELKGGFRKATLTIGGKVIKEVTA